MSYTKMLSQVPPSAVNEPIIANLIRKFELNCNILKATIYLRKRGMAVIRSERPPGEFSEKGFGI
jgi:hypothetical protein